MNLATFTYLHTSLLTCILACLLTFLYTCLQRRPNCPLLTVNSNRPKSHTSHPPNFHQLYLVNFKINLPDLGESALSSATPPKITKQTIHQLPTGHIWVGVVIINVRLISVQLALDSQLERSLAKIAVNYHRYLKIFIQIFFIHFFLDPNSFFPRLRRSTILRCQKKYFEEMHFRTLKKIWQKELCSKNSAERILPPIIQLRSMAINFVAEGKTYCLQIPSLHLVLI